MNPSMLKTWNAIAEHLGVSARAAQYWARRCEDPLPVRRFVGRVEANVAEIEAWRARQYRTLEARACRSTSSDV